MRLAELRDVSWVMDCLHDLHKESTSYRGLIAEHDLVCKTITTFVDHPSILFVVNEHKSFMIVAIDTPWFAPSVVYGYELILYVDPQYRGSSEAVRMIRDVEKRCTDLGVKRLHVGASVGINDERTMKLYERLGYERTTAPARKDF